MKRKINIDKKWKSVFAFIALSILLIVVACEVSFHEMKILNEDGLAVTSVNAGDSVIFTFDVYINATDDKANEKLIVGVLTPKSWDAKNNTKITLLAPSSNLGNVWQEFEPIPTGTYPADKDYSGVEWPEALKIWIKDDPNIEDADMGWTAFISKNGADVMGGGGGSTVDWKDLKLTVRMKTGPDNVRSKLGFYIGNNSNALGGDLNGSLKSYNDWTYSDCFEVTNGGEGDLIDFCVLHYNSAVPGSSTQNDLISFRFNGGIDENPGFFLNDLAYESEVYINAKAYTIEGKTYTQKIKMARLSEFGRSFSVTCWPEQFFGIDRSETLSRIEYYFSNEDGSKFVDYLDDKIQSGGVITDPDVLNNGRDRNREKEPFNFSFTCR